VGLARKWIVCSKRIFAGNSTFQDFRMRWLRTQRCFEPSQRIAEATQYWSFTGFQAERLRYEGQVMPVTRKEMEKGFLFPGAEVDPVQGRKEQACRHDVGPMGRERRLQSRPDKSPPGAKHNAVVLFAGERSEHAMADAGMAPFRQKAFHAWRGP